MTSHDSNESSVTTLQDLLKILPKQEQTLQVRMQDHSASSSSSSSSNSNRNNRNNLANNHRNSNSNNNVTSCYHTLRYDFKPASINSDEPAKLEFTKDGQVTIMAPNVGGSICTFRGQKRPHIKECLLVIDNKTGEVTLQKLTDNITVKATRTIGGGGSGGGGGGSGGSANGNGNGTSSGGGGGGNGNYVVNGSSNGPASSSSSNSSLMASNNNHNSNDKMSAINSVVNDNDISTSDHLQSISVQSRIDGPQLSEESSDSNSDSDGSSSDSSDSSAESSSNSSSPNHQGFTF